MSVPSAPPPVPPPAPPAPPGRPAPAPATGAQALPAAAAAPPAPARRPLSRILTVGGALLLLLAWLLVAVFLRVQRQDMLDTRARENANLARAQVETTLRVLAAIDQATLRLAETVAESPGARHDPQAIVQIARETGLVPAILVQLSVVGPDGRFRGSNLDPDGQRTGPVDLGEREHVRIHLRPGAPDAGLFIGPPVLGKVSGRWTIQISRRIAGPGGRVLGVIVASLDPSYVESVYRQVELGPHGVVALVGSDRVVRARVADGRSQGLGSGGVAPHVPLDSPRPPEGGHYVGISAVDGVERVVAFQKVPGYPLFVFVASAREHALKDWRSLVLMSGGLLGALTLVVAGALRVLAKSVQRLEAHRDALALSESRAQAANQAKNEFLAAVSHELRTPLTSIRGFAELMETRLEEPRYRHAAGMIRRSAEHLNALLSEILDLARVEAGAMPIAIAPVPLLPLLQAKVDFFRVSADEKGLDLQLALDGELPATLPADELRLKQILNNLLSNALKFTARGSVTLAARRAPDASALWIEVRDTGPGVPPEQAELIFERFRQASPQITNDHGGTGLGLALARALAERMGGQLQLLPGPGPGACFRLQMPLA